MTRPSPAPKACDTTEEVRAYWADTDRERNREYDDRPDRWDY